MTTEDAWSTLGEINQWIRFADAKASVLLTASGVLGGILLSHDGVALKELVAWPDLARTMCLIIVTLSGLFSVAALLPRLRVRRTVPASLVYFDHVARRFARASDQYLAAFEKAADDSGAVRREVVGQIWANSIVARRKFRYVTWSTWLLAVALVGTGVSVYTGGF